MNQTAIQISNILGLLTAFCVIGLALRPILYNTNKSLITNGKKMPGWLSALYQWLRKNHRYIGMLAVTLMISHALLKFFFDYLSLTGALTALTLLVQAVLGNLLKIQKDKAKRINLAKLHKYFGFLIIIALIIHRLFPGSQL